jgi:GTP-binding protein EngB required for normal cell division
MYMEAQKLHLIEELLKVDNDSVLDKLEKILTQTKNHLPRSNNFQQFTSSLTMEEVDELEHNINEGCEQVNHAAG